ncbi:protein FAM227A-like [Clavelina lepadiformis]|uniref:protein FAM227A-like n=1 Tax=Clavelina lepadiformis TaxID=159417 RepID=UPI004041011E
MVDISRIASPMSLCEEDLFDVDKKVERKKKELASLQKIRPASFLVGSIDKVNKRISSLNNELSFYDSKLAIESRSSHNEEIYDPDSGTFQAKSTGRKTTRSAKSQEERETKKFAGRFSQASNLIPQYQAQRKKGSATKSDTPRLVELQQYPGFTKSYVTPLPHSLETTTVLDHVMSAQHDLKRKPIYRQQIVKMLYSKTQRSILQDTFWWFFLNKYHPSQVNQSKLFKRISHSFVNFMLSSDNPTFKNKFFLIYANVLAQSVYSAFCLAFPQSWRQFDEPEFKEKLMRITNVWISGIQPSPRLYEKWNYKDLEPKKMRKEETLKNKKSSEKDKRAPVFGKTSPSGSFISTKPSTMQSRVGSNKGARSEGISSVSSHKTKAHGLLDRGPLPPITEKLPTANNEEINFQDRVSTTKKQTNSSATGRQVSFDRSVFNIYGNSPLLRGFLSQRCLDKKTGVDHLVKRTQIDSYAPSDSKTFSDIINETSIDSKRASSAFKRMHLDNEKACNEFATKQNEELKNYSIKSGKLLSKPRQVRHLSNLILMEMKRDADEPNTVGVVAAIQSALAAETVN